MITGKRTRVLVQGGTGSTGRRHIKEMLIFGTQIKAVVTPGKGGLEVEGIPVFNDIKQAMDQIGKIDASIIFVPPMLIGKDETGKPKTIFPATDAIIEAINAKIPLIIAITEKLPQWQMVKIKAHLEAFGKDTVLIGPNTPGMGVPKECKIGILPNSIFQKKGHIAVFSRSGSVCTEIAILLKKANVGMSFLVGIGGDSIIGTDFVDMLKIVKNDKNTKAVIIGGEIGGKLEEEAADYITENNYPKPVLFFIAGTFAPKTQTPLGHAGAITGQRDGSMTKAEYIKTKGQRVCQNILKLSDEAKNL